MRVVRDNIENEVKHSAIGTKRQEDKIYADNNVENADKTNKVNTAKVGEAQNDVGSTTQKTNDANPNVIVGMPVTIPQKNGENKVVNQRVTISINRLIDILTGKSQQVDRSNAIYIRTEGKVPPIEEMRKNTNPFGAIPEGFKPDIYIAPQNVDAAIKAFEAANNSKLQPYIERLKAGENDIKWD